MDIEKNHADSEEEEGMLVFYTLAQDRLIIKSLT